MSWRARGGCRDGKQVSSSSKKLASSKNDFERGAVDVFTLTCANLGAITHIVIGQDGRGMGSAWHLDQVAPILGSEDRGTCFVHGGGGC